MASKRKPPKRYTDEDLERAVTAVQTGSMSIRAAEDHYSVPHETIRRHLRGVSNSTKPGPKPHLGNVYEKELCDAVVELNKMSEGVTISDLRFLAAQITESSTLEPFKGGMPSRMWARRFQARHDLKTRQPVNISIARLRMETVEVKENFFNKLDSLYKELLPLGLNAAQIFNCDETGLCVLTKSGKGIAGKGEKTVRVKKGGERGENITVIATANATGSVILPPTVIFRGKTINEDLMTGAMSGVIFASSPRSFIDHELFEEWFVRFVQLIPPARPVVLLMDGHGAHITKKVIEVARENKIHILLFPPHTTHLYQPLDRGVFGPLKKAFDHEGRKLARKNKLQALNRYHFCKILNPAWLKAVTPSNVVGGFEGAGVWPFDPSRVTLPCERGRKPQDSPIGEEIVSLDPLGPQTENTSDPAQSLVPVAVTASTSGERVLHSPTEDNVSPVVEVVRRYLQPREENINTPVRSKRVTTARLITSNEFLKEMEAKEKEKEEKEKAKKEKAEEKKRKASEKACGLSKKSSKENKPAEEKKKKAAEKARLSKENLKENNQKKIHPKELQKGPEKAKRQAKNKKFESESEDSSDVDNPDSLSSDSDSEIEELCGTCKKSFQNDFNGEKWIKCSACCEWYHNKCQDLTEDYFCIDFKCEECLPLGEIVEKK